MSRPCDCEYKKPLSRVSEQDKPENVRHGAVHDSKCLSILAIPALDVGENGCFILQWFLTISTWRSCMRWGLKRDDDGSHRSIIHDYNIITISLVSYHPLELTFVEDWWWDTATYHRPRICLLIFLLDVWCMVYDVWCMVYDVGCMVYDVWCMV